MEQWDWKRYLFVILIIPLIYFLPGYLGKYTSQYSDVGKESDIRVIVSSQDSEGITQENLDLNYLNFLESYTVEQAESGIKKLLESKGYDGNSVKFSSEAIYVESDSMKLGVIRLRASDGSNHVLIVGVVGNELKRVTCARESGETIPINFGVCGEKIKEVFGEKIGE